MFSHSREVSCTKFKSMALARVPLPTTPPPSPFLGGFCCYISTHKKIQWSPIYRIYSTIQSHVWCLPIHWRSYVHGHLTVGGFQSDEVSIGRVCYSEAKYKHAWKALNNWPKRKAMKYGANNVIRIIVKQKGYNFLVLSLYILLIQAFNHSSIYKTNQHNNDQLINNNHFLYLA